MLLDALRSATRPLHDQLEQSLDIQRRLNSFSDYQNLLRRFYGFYEPLERRLARVAGYETIPFDPRPRFKAQKLHADLMALGLSNEEITAIPQCDQLPNVDGPAQAMGCWYVLEGATLGGQMIRRHLESRLGLDVNSGGNFFYSYGREVGPMWNAFCILLNQSAFPPSDELRAVTSAVETFGSFGDWLKDLG